MRGYTDREQGDLINLLQFFQNKESIVAYLRYARTAEPQKQQLLSNTSAQQ
jgi:hypothetical protein